MLLYPRLNNLLDNFKVIYFSFGFNLFFIVLFLYLDNFTNAFGGKMVLVNVPKFILFCIFSNFLFLFFIKKFKDMIYYSFYNFSFFILYNLYEIFLYPLFIIIFQNNKYNYDIVSMSFFFVLIFCMLIIILFLSSIVFYLRKFYFYLLNFK